VKKRARRAFWKAVVFAMLGGLASWAGTQRRLTPFRRPQPFSTALVHSLIVLSVVWPIAFLAEAKRPDDESHTS
jgi:hypothetical protein